MREVTSSAHQQLVRGAHDVLLCTCTSLCSYNQHCCVRARHAASETTQIEGSHVCSLESQSCMLRTPPSKASSMQHRAL